MKNFITKTLNGMAYGLFATLIVGVILQQIGNLLKIDFISNDLYLLLSQLMGVGIALGIGVVLKLNGLNLVMVGIVGAISTRFNLVYESGHFQIVEANAPGNPVTAYFVTIFSILLINLILVKKTPVDILIIPITAILISLALTIMLSLPLNFIINMISQGVDKATTLLPIPMVIIISVVMGMILTSPISSAAIAFSIGISGVAAGAAVVGTTIQMVGFAIQSRRDNKMGTIISIGIGTSMLQFKNIVKKPIIWLPTILSSAIIAPFVYLLGFESTTAGAGMGSSGLVGILQSLEQMNYSLNSFISIGIIVLIGGLLTYIFDKILLVKGYIQKGDLSVGIDL
ncbi:MAG TPA: PTS sugar transporter subunit IIC [Acholeplasma sp.]|nr:PTS sugar transporter subunit IIC [Acholeplasma sp.]